MNNNTKQLQRCNNKQFHQSTTTTNNNKQQQQQQQTHNIRSHLSSKFCPCDFATMQLAYGSATESFNRRVRQKRRCVEIEASQSTDDSEFEMVSCSAPVP